MLTASARTQRTHATSRHHSTPRTVSVHARAHARGHLKPRCDLLGHILNLRTRGMSDSMTNDEMRAQERYSKAGLLACGDGLWKWGTLASRLGEFEAPDGVFQHLHRSVSKRASRMLCGRMTMRACTCEGRDRGWVAQRRGIWSIQCGARQIDVSRCETGGCLTWSKEGLHGGLSFGWGERVGAALRLCGAD